MRRYIWVRGKPRVGTVLKNSRGLDIGEITQLSWRDGELVEIHVDDVCYVRVGGKKTLFQRWSSIGDKNHASKL